MRVGAWTRRRSMWLDIGLAAVAAAECGGSAAVFAFRQGLGTAAVVAVAVFGVIAGSTLLVRRRWPLIPVAAALATIPLDAGYTLLMIGVYTLGAYRPEGVASRFAERRAMTALCALAIAETVIVSTLTLGTQQQNALRHGVAAYVLVILSVLVAIGISVPPAMLGLYIGAKRRLLEALRERAEGLETEISLLADQAHERARRARMEERTRIAREMHDVVAHRVSLLVVHAGALERVVHKDPDRAAQSAKLMGDIGRQALDELRQILGVLRTVEPDEQEPAPLGAAAEGDEAAALGLADLPKLVDESRAAGLGVRYTLGGLRRELPAQAERTAYRVVQEALTNVLKHAPGTDVEVVIAYIVGGVALAVSNTCPAADTTPAADRGLPSGGNGLVGMRERVHALGGTFAAGPTAEGGYRVEARLVTATATA
ncbi:sensor histidine kinase [Streptacidiphilus pinicola]|uniref:histidine kinase n=1 Tax=Streptacidiphilus pinicola TaxID=2219663 RepID=A0A2X0J4W6_9ACTN|nr:histidine kinase [Streptacidiphilus pinicola]RAG85276.1 sensor histidine kinase [Streptacidiphilus pinicola]